MSPSVRTLRKDTSGNFSMLPMTFVDGRRSSGSRALRPEAVLLLAALAFSTLSCGGSGDLPEPGTETYRRTVTAFFTGVTAVQSGQDQLAGDELERVTELAPGEPAGWANRGLLALRQREFDRADRLLGEAESRAPDHPHVLRLVGLLHSNRGEYQEAIDYFERSIEADPANVRSRYLLAVELERQGGAGSGERVQSLFREILDRRPHNLAVQVELLRVGAKEGDRAVVDSMLQVLADRSDGWPEEVIDQLDAVRSSVSDGISSETGTEIAFLKNVLKQLPSYREGLSVVQTPAAQVGLLMTRFVVLEAPETEIAEPDPGLSYASAPVGENADWARAVYMDRDAEPVLIRARDGRLELGGDRSIPFPLGSGADAQDRGPRPEGVAPVDVDFDFRVDLALAGDGGFRLFHQDSTGALRDVTGETGISAEVVDGRYFGAWGADVDMEGDLDIVLAPLEDSPLVLRNDGDGTFTPIRPFGGVAAPRDFAWADLDADGDPDAAVLDEEGELHLFENLRGGEFIRHSSPGAGSGASLEVTDADGDGVLDLLLLRVDGAISHLDHGSWSEDWQVHELIEDVGGTEYAAGAVDLRTADLDNNGGLDLLVSGVDSTRVWLRDREGTFERQNTLPVRVNSEADLDGDGRLDLAGEATTGGAVRLLATGARDYNWQTVRPQAATTSGDQRVNSFGIGGEMEVRTGLFFQKRVIGSSVMHFGLGEHEEIDLMRIVWPNGSVQAEFDLASGQAVETEQRLKGSCPWLFTWNGSEMEFATDLLWRSGVGIRINGHSTAGVLQTHDRVKLEGARLAEENGRYRMSITGELWETHFFDHVALEVVDHPEGTRVFVDERFSIPPPDLRVHVTGPLRPLVAARDQTGRDVTPVLRERDREYLGGFGKTAYQGVAHPHYVELELPSDRAGSGPLLLVASGWIRPTDSSINLALSQGASERAGGIHVQVPEGDEWRTVAENIGFPAGKTKTMVIDLADLVGGPVPERVRLRTRAEIYWDRIAWTRGRPDVEPRIDRVPLDSADLRYRGFSRVVEKNDRSPERPIYEEIAATAPRWRDLIGYYTRFGPVDELVSTVDDRYVIMNAGDEMRVRFRAPEPVEEGWTRDFVVITDGWVKDGDYNTRFSKTVRPLPIHGVATYEGRMGPLTEQEVYRAHPTDWIRYHTRYVDTRRFQRAMSLPGWR